MVCRRRLFLLICALAINVNTSYIWANALSGSLTDVTFTATQTGGTSSTANSTGIALTFSQPVTGLYASHITITDGTGAAVKGTALSVSGNTYTIGLASVTTQGTVNVSVSNFGTFHVTNNPQTVTVYKNTSGLTIVTGVTVSPSTVTVQKGTQYQFSATVTGTNSPSQSVTWSVNSTAGSSISATGLLTVAAGETAATLTVTATSAADGTKSGTATVTVSNTAPPTPTVTGVTVNPSTATLQKGTQYQFSATVQGTNSPSQSVTWSVNGTAGSSISASGLLSIAAGETAATLTVTATSAADGTKSGTATVTISNTPTPTVTSVTVNPVSVTLNRGGTHTFSAVVNGTNSPGQGVTWIVSGGSTGTGISASGVLTIAANETATTLTVRATSTADNTKSGTATVTVSQPVGYTITFDPNGGTLYLTTRQTGADGKLPSWPEPTRSGYDFIGWYTHPTSGTRITVSYVFTANTTVYAHWHENLYSWGSGGGGGGGGSTAVTGPATMNDTVTVNGVIVPYTYDPSTGTMTVNFTASLLDKIVAASGGSNPIVINMGGSANMKGLSVSFPPSWFANHPSTSFSVQSAIGGFTLDNNLAMKFPSQTSTARVSLRKGSIILSAEQSDKAVTWNNPAAPIMLYMTYTPAKDANTNAIVLYDKATGKTVAHSFYANGRVYGAVSGPGEYDAKIVTAPVFTDTADHWAKNDIDFVAGHGLIAGTSATAFSPNSAITRADFLTALGKLSGADVSGYKASSFTDVKNDDPAMPYIEWAVQNKIVTGIGNNKFGPGQQITREQMALMMVNYAKVMGMTLPEIRQAVTFADDAKISSWAKDAVKAVQRAGIITGKSNNLFDPQGSATRGEASAILHRFAENVVKGKQGWVQNDDGQWQYINAEEKAVTGWLTTTEGSKYWFDDKCFRVSGKWVQIEGKWYYFGTDGKLVVNTTIDGYEVGEDGARK